MAKAPDKAAVFSGEYRHSLDPKKRVTIPAIWRSPEGVEVFIIKNPKRACLNALPAPIFEKIGEEAKLHAPSLADYRTFMSHFYSQATSCTIDKQGRLLLPEQACAELDLQTDVLLAGVGDRFEIWNPTEWTAFRDAGRATYERVADLIGL